MKAPVILTLGLTNAVLALAIGRILVFAVPTIDEDVALTAPQRLAPEGRAKPARDADQDISAGLTMFGLRTALPKRDIGLRPVTQTPADEVNFKLLGVLLADDGTGKAATVILLAHGSPPVVIRLLPGAIVDGWRLVSATRISAALVKPDGTERVVWLGKPLTSLAPRN